MQTSNAITPLSAEALETITPAALIVIILEQQKLIEVLSAEVAGLKEQMGTDSKTSSKPPSSDLLKKSENEKAAPSSSAAGEPRKPGGQPGHVGKTRKGFGRVDRYEILRPAQCPSCGGQEFEELPVRQQQHSVARLVAQPIEIVSYEQQQCRCLCGELVSGEWPSDVIATQDLSVGLQSLLAWLGNYSHLSYGKQQEFLRELGDIEIGVGTLQATNRRVADAVIEPVDHLWRWARSQAHVHVDETPWTVMGVKEWLWVSGAESFCLFHAAGTRSRDELKAMLGDSFDGVLISDDFSVYNGYEVTAQQKCLAHLRRHFKRIERLESGLNQTMATAFLKLIDEAFKQHRQWREHGDSTLYAHWAKIFKNRVATTLKKWTGKVTDKAEGLLNSLKLKAQQWWYFLDHPEIPPDNNLAERLIRLAVTKRKVCGGSRSMLRFEQTADLLSVIQTCRRQGRSSLDFFRQALTAQHHDLTLMPSLIPVAMT
jgi:transposase